MSTTGANPIDSEWNRPRFLSFTMPSLTSPRRSLLLFLATALPLAYADVEFTSPAASAVMPVGVLNVAWKESGRPPVIEELSGYILCLMVGGNEVNNSYPIYTLEPAGTFINHSIVSTIPSGISGDVPNGFYLRMTSTSLNTGIVVDYSDRFTLTGMTGIVASEYLNAAKALDGNTAGPPRSGNVPAITSGLPRSTSTSSTSSSTPHTVTVTSAAKSSQSAPAQSNIPNSTSLSMGAIVGIVIAVFAGASIILALIIFFLLHRRRRKLRDGVIDNVDPSAFGINRPPASWKQPSVTTLSELSADGRVMEMGDGLPPPEMDSNAIRAELEGDSLYYPQQRPPPPAREGSVGSGSTWEPQTPLTPIAPSVFEETLQGPIDFTGSPVTPVSRI